MILVPERHKDGAWHIHGLIHDLPASALAPFGTEAPRRLNTQGFLNWPDYMDKFGFCSLAPIRNPVGTAFYITKYISKDLSRRYADLGKHLYFHSRPLQKAVKASEVYYYNQALDECCVNDYDFCKTGMIYDVPWYFPYIWEGVDVPTEPMDPKPVEKAVADFAPEEIDPFYEQLSIQI